VVLGKFALQRTPTIADVLAGKALVISAFICVHLRFQNYGPFRLRLRRAAFIRGFRSLALLIGSHSRVYS